MKSTLTRIIMNIFLLILLIPNLTFAETKTFIKEYTYQASEVDSKQTCRILALEQVKRLLLEEMGTYMESNREVVNYQLKKSEITSLSAGVVQAKVLREKWDGEKYWMEASITADPDDVAKRINELLNNREKRQAVENERKKVDETIKQTTQLRNELMNDKDNQAKIKEYNEKVQAIKMMSTFSNAMQKMVSNKPEEAIGSMMQGMMEVIKNSGSDTPLNTQAAEN